MAFEWSREARFYGGVAGTTGAAATVSGPDIDMSIYSGAYAAAYIEVTSTATTLTALVGTATDAMSETTGVVEGSQGFMFMDIRQPIKRYLKFQLNTTGGAANSVLMCWAYGARSKPTSNTTAVVGSRFYSPGTGTATG